MDLRRARTFVTVAELGTVLKAAERLHVAQPALSRQIGHLEEELGLKLFDRVGRRLVLTGEGAQLLGDCRNLLRYAGVISERAQLLRQGDTGNLNVAASPQFIEGVLSSFLHRYAQRFPNVQVKLMEAVGSTDALGMLERGEIHVGQSLLRALPAGEERFVHRPLEVVETLAAGDASMLPGKSRTIEIARVAAHPLLLLDTSFFSRRTLDATFRLAGVAPNVVFESRTAHTLLAMAEMGHGIAIVPSAVRIDRYRLRILRVTHRNKPVRERLAVFWDNRRALPPYATAFCTLLGEYVREVFPISRPSVAGRTSEATKATPKGRAR